MSGHEHEFRWDSSVPSSVTVSGTFDNWRSTLHLEREESGHFSGKTFLPYGSKVLFKYIIDGQWQANPNEPTENDGSGNINNVLHIPEESAAKAVKPTSEAAEPQHEAIGTGFLSYMSSGASAAVGAATAGMASVAAVVSSGMHSGATQAHLGNDLPEGQSSGLARENPVDPAPTPAVSGGQTSLPTVPSGDQLSQSIAADKTETEPAVLPLIPDTTTQGSSVSAPPKSDFVPVVPAATTGSSSTEGSSSKGTIGPKGEINGVAHRSEPLTDNSTKIISGTGAFLPHHATSSESSSSKGTIGPKGEINGVASQSSPSSTDKSTKIISGTGAFLPHTEGSSSSPSTTSSSPSNAVTIGRIGEFKSHDGKIIDSKPANLDHNNGHARIISGTGAFIATTNFIPAPNTSSATPTLSAPSASKSVEAQPDSKSAATDGSFVASPAANATAGSANTPTRPVPVSQPSESGLADAIGYYPIGLVGGAAAAGGAGLAAAAVHHKQTDASAPSTSTSSAVPASETFTQWPVSAKVDEPLTGHASGEPVLSTTANKERETIAAPTGHTIATSAPIDDKMTTKSPLPLPQTVANHHTAATGVDHGASSNSALPSIASPGAFGDAIHQDTTVTHGDKGLASSHPESGYKADIMDVVHDLTGKNKKDQHANDVAQTGSSTAAASSGITSPGAFGSAIHEDTTVVHGAADKGIASTHPQSGYKADVMDVVNDLTGKNKKDHAAADAAHSGSSTTAASSGITSPGAFGSAIHEDTTVVHGAADKGIASTHPQSGYKADVMDVVNDLTGKNKKDHAAADHAGSSTAAGSSGITSPGAFGSAIHEDTTVTHGAADKGLASTHPESGYKADVMDVVHDITGKNKKDKKAEEAALSSSSTSAAVPDRRASLTPASEATATTATAAPAPVSKADGYATLSKGSAPAAPVTPTKNGVTPGSTNSTPATGGYKTAPSTPATPVGGKRERKSSFFQKVKGVFSSPKK